MTIEVLGNLELENLTENEINRRLVWSSTIYLTIWTSLFRQISIIYHSTCDKYEHCEILLNDKDSTSNILANLFSTARYTAIPFFPLDARGMASRAFCQCNEWARKIGS